MKRLTLAFAVCAPLAMGIAACDSGGVKVADNGKTATLDCGGKSAEVTGNENVLNLTGACSSLSVSGSKNRVIVALAKGGSVAVSGAGNTVTWKTPDDSEPKVSSSGSDNTVQKGL